MAKHSPVVLRRYQSGSLLLESLIAILIFSVGILAVVGLQAQSIRDVTGARARIEASNVANQIVGEIWANVTTPTSIAGTYNDTSTKIGTLASQLPSGKAVVAVTPIVVPSGGTINNVTVTLTWRPPGASVDSSFVVQTSVNNTL